MFAAGKTAAVSGAGPDEQFNYVTMLLHGDGTNGAQNNTFLDSSTNNFTITRNGNTTQGSFSPYGSNWSNYFDGTGDGLSIASASALNIGSADMTMEFWMLIPSAFASNYRVVFAKGNNASGGNSYAFEGMASGELTLWVNTDGSSGWNLFNGTTIGTPTVGAWNHVVVCRSGTTWYSFMNGTRVLNTTGAGTVTASSTAVTIGDFSTGGFEYTGYVSNLRLVNGTAVYANATTCTVPTTPLTAVTNTALLTCQSNRFLDNSTNNFTITTTGTPSVQRFNPFGASSAYSTSVIGGSGYFDGSGDYLGVPYSANLTMTGDFTAECWVYVTSAPQAYGGILAFSNDSENVGWNILIGGTTTKFHFNVAMTYTDTATSMTLNAWTHLALVRSGSTGKLYINGVADANTVTTSATATCPTNPQIGRYPLISDRNFFGYISNVRVVKGTAVYTSNFTPPTAPVTSITNTQLLLNYTNGAIFDNAMMNDLETVGNAQISTSVKKYGTGSLAFDGTGDWLQTPSTPNTNLGSGNFTVECWFYKLSTKIASCISLNGALSSNGYALGESSTTAQRLWWYSQTTRILSNTNFSYNTWNHVAVVRNGATTTMYQNGVNVGSFTDSINYSGTILYVGSDEVGTQEWNGYLDEVRITKGYARYTANFTPPTAAFPNIGPT
jgi:hypothetical protein